MQDKKDEETDLHLSSFLQHASKKGKSRECLKRGYSVELRAHDEIGVDEDDL